MSASDTRQGPGSPGRIRLLDRKAVAWITLVVTLLASLALARYFDAQIERRSAERFRLNAEIEQGVLASRLKAYELALRGVAGLFAGSAQVDRAEWEAYANILAVPRFVPGLQAIGHARVFPAHVRAALEARIRAEGFADFRVHPPSDAALQSSVVFISPQNAGNALAFGYDMLTEPTRKAAMEASARSGAVTLAGPLSLIQNGAPKPRTGFVLYLATHAQPAPSEAAPPAMPAGFAFASFYIADVMLPLLGDGARALDITLYDGSIGENRLLFSTATGQHAPAHTLDLPIDFGGQHWIARFSSSTEFEAAHASSRPATVLAGGVIVGLLLFSMLFINARHRGRLASVATRLAQSREEFRTLVENVPGVVFRCETHPPWRVSHISKRITELTGEDAEQFIHGACHFATFMHDDDIAPVAEQIEQAMAERRPYVVEYRVIDRKGRQRWVSEHGQAHFDADGQPLWLDGVLLDVTEHRAAEDAIRNLAFVNTLTQLPNRRFLLDRLRQAWPTVAATDATARCSSSTSTTSRRSTTRTVTTPATSCCARSRRGCATACAKATPWRGWAVTSSWSCSKTWATAERRPAKRPRSLPRTCSSSSTAPSCSMTRRITTPRASASAASAAPTSARKTCCGARTRPCTAPRPKAAIASRPRTSGPVRRLKPEACAGAEWLGRSRQGFR